MYTEIPSYNVCSFVIISISHIILTHFHEASRYQNALYVWFTPCLQDLHFN